jgi:NRAMP (natural resistance-associated macrophage protein)-like metal ion transporter
MSWNSRLSRFWKNLGPGLVTGAADNDPSAITTYAIAGAHFGFALSWLLLWILPFMIAIQNMCARIGALSGCGLAGNMRKHYPAWLLAIAVGSIVVANTLNVGADIYGMAGAINLLIPGISIQVTAILMSIFIMTMVIVLRYRHIEMLFKWFSISLLVYGVALVLVRPDWLTLAWHVLIPTIVPTRAYLLTAFAVLGTTLSPYLYFWQASQEAEELRQDRPSIRVCKFRPVHRGMLGTIGLDTKIGMIASNLISFFILSLMASVVWTGTGGAELTTLRDAANALQPFAGRYAFLLFTLGIISSGLLAIPVLAGSAAYALSEMMGWPASIDKPFNRARPFYLVMVGSVVVSMVVPFLGITPVQALLWSAIIMGLSAPLLIGLVVHMAKNPDIVGPHKSSLPVHTLGLGALFFLLTGSLFVIFS